MAIKLVAIDLDDTLLGDDLIISEHCLNTIRAIQEKGVLVTLATGRMYSSALPYARQLKMDIPIITYQGALVKNSLSGEILYYKPVPGVLAVKIMEYFEENNVHYHAYFGDRLCMKSLTEEGKCYANLAGIEPVIMEDLIYKAKSQETFKILSVTEDYGLLLEMELELKGMYGRELNITRSKPFFLETMNSLANKGDALQVVARHYNIERKEVLAIGDSYNDLQMIEWAGIGVAMGNARDTVKEAADYVTFSNEEEGVAEALRKFVLN